MKWFLARRVSLADAIYGATVGGVYVEHGLLTACAAAAGLGVLLSAARYLAQAE